MCLIQAKYALQLTRLEQSFTKMLAAVPQAFEQSSLPTVADLPVFPRIIFSDHSHIPNAHIAPISSMDAMGIEVTAAVLELIPVPKKNERVDDFDNVAAMLAAEFVVAHELAHACTKNILDRLKLLLPCGELAPTLSPAVHEVVADLGAVQLLRYGLDYSWDELSALALQLVPRRLVDSGWSGQHPPGYVRAQAMAELVGALKLQPTSFFPAAQKILAGLPFPPGRVDIGSGKFVDLQTQSQLITPRARL